jgi:hypothetical protein
MLVRGDPVVEFKLSLVDRVLPTKSAFVFGDMYIVDGGYTRYIAEQAEGVILLDTLETKPWQRARLEQSNLEFYKGNFAEEAFMRSLPQPHATVGLAFDVLLHQAALLHALHLMLEKVEHSFVFAHPTLEEQPLANSLVFLPGHPDQSLYPYPVPDEEYRAFSLVEVNQTHWIWGITASWMRTALQTEGFEIVHEESLDGQLKERWNWWGGVAERRTWPGVLHWSHMQHHPGLHDGWED